MHLKVIAVLSFFHLSHVLAAPPYRCSGWISQRPCTQVPTNSPAGRDIHITNQKRAQAKIPYAKINKASLKTLNEKEGLWTGEIEGNGEIHMALEVTHTSNQTEKLPMGIVNLRNTSSGFSYRSSLPQGAGWSWQILATAKAK